MIAKELMTKHQLRQMEVAELLSVSQPAISLYCRNMRGKAIDLQNDYDVRDLVENVPESLARSRLSRRDLILTYCRICRTIRARGLLCRLHKAFDPTIDIEKFELCSINDSIWCF